MPRKPHSLRTPTERDFPFSLWKKDSRFLSTDLYFWDTRFLIVRQCENPFQDGIPTRHSRSVAGSPQWPRSLTIKSGFTRAFPTVKPQ